MHVMAAVRHAGRGSCEESYHHQDSKTGSRDLGEDVCQALDDGDVPSEHCRQSDGGVHMST